MPKTITRTTKVYTIEELKERDQAAYRKALEEMTEIAVEIYDPEEISQDVADYYIEEQHGFTVNTITRRNIGGYRHGKWDPQKEYDTTVVDLSWGDYSLGFNGTVKDLPAKIRAYRKEGKLTNQEATMLLQDEIYFTVKMGPGNEPGCSLEMDDFYIHTDAATARAEKLFDLLEAELRTACQEALMSAHQQRDDTTGEEALLELAEANDYTFTEAGKLYNARNGDVVADEEGEDEGE